MRCATVVLSARGDRPGQTGAFVRVDRSRYKSRVIRVVHLSTSDSSGGAARAAFRLHTGLRRIGVESSMLVEERKSGDEHVRAFRPPSDLLSRLRRRARRGTIAKDSARYSNRPPSLDWFSDDRTPYAGQIVPQIPPCDVINLHWVAGFVDRPEEDPAPGVDDPLQLPGCGAVVHHHGGRRAPVGPGEVGDGLGAHLGPLLAGEHVRPHGP